MASSTGSSPSVSERLVAGAIALVEAGGAGDLSVRRLAESAERSTMCVYSHFGGRHQLVLAAYRSAAADVLELMRTTPAGERRSVALATWCEQHPALARWLLTTRDPDSVDQERRTLIEEVIAAAGEGGDQSETRQWLATLTGSLVLYDAASPPVI